MVYYLVKIVPNQSKMLVYVEYKGSAFLDISRSPEGAIKKAQRIIRVLHRIRGSNENVY